jgi:death-on-curing protein
VTAFDWPDGRALLDELAAHMAERGETLSLVDAEAFEAGLNRARLAEPYGEADLHTLAALMFEGVATRHPLVDGNKRLAFLAMVSFLTLNGAWLDAPEGEIARLCIAVVAKEESAAALAAYLRARCG